MAKNTKYFYTEGSKQVTTLVAPGEIDSYAFSCHTVETLCMAKNTKYFHTEGSKQVTYACRSRGDRLLRILSPHSEKCMYGEKHEILLHRRLKAGNLRLSLQGSRLLRILSPHSVEKCVPPNYEGVVLDFFIEMLYNICELNLAERKHQCQNTNTSPSILTAH